jgi:tRNA(Ile)-lysidine synthase
LLYLLHQLREQLGITLHSAHLNHQFRGQEAERDAAFVQQFSSTLGIPCSVETRDVPALIEQQKLSPQDTARQVRYQFFEELAHKLHAQKIATAHTANDQAETVLLGLLRGVGLHGLGGIQPVLKGMIIRPLLEITRDQIVSFTRAAHLDYVEDSSNASRKYRRNAVRLDLLPFLEQHFNPSIIKRFTAYAQLFREDAACIEHVAHMRFQDVCKNVGQMIKINLDLFAKECISIQRELLYQSFASLTGARHRLETQHARMMIDLFTHKSPGKRLSLPENVIAYRSYAWGCLAKQQGEPSRRDAQPTDVPIPGSSVWGAFCIETEMLPSFPKGASFSSHDAHTGWQQCMDFEHIVPPVTVRRRRPGDAFRPLGMPGKKSLKKFFIDRKIPRDTRESIPIFEDTVGIFWVVGYGIDERVKITPRTTQILRCRVTTCLRNNNS